MIFFASASANQNDLVEKEAVVGYHEYGFVAA